MKILFITSSMLIGNPPRGSVSDSAIKMFKAFYLAKNPTHEVIDLNLNDLPIAQKSLNSHNYTNFFNKGDAEIEQLKNVNKIVMASPMTNFNYPAVIKNYMDHILQAKKTFLYKYDGKVTSEGLLPHLKVQLITTQGAPLGWYPFGNHTETLRGTWDFVGAKVTLPIIIHGTRAPEMRNLTAEEIIKNYGFDQQLKKAAEKF